MTKTNVLYCIINNRRLKENMIIPSPLISVIVPVYNVEQYLVQCIDSILNQKYENFELLLVDDGSTDRSGEICDVYEKKDKRVRVFHKKNGGVSSARNVGLDNAKGEWIAFVDSDDIVTPNYLSELYSDVKSDVDLVIQKYFIFKDYLKDERFLEAIKETDIYDKSDLQKLIVEYHLYKNGHIWSKLYKQEFIQNNNIRFQEEISFCEDYYFLFQYLDVIYGKVVCSYVANYFYRDRDNSSVHVGFKDFEKGYFTFRKIKSFILSFAVRNNCKIKDFDVAYLLHRAIMTAKSTSQLRSITSEDWDFFLNYFKVFTRKTKNDRWVVSHFKSHPFILLTYIKACRSLRNFLARTNMWGILDALKK